MHRINRRFASGMMALVLLGALSGSVQAADSHYGMVGLYNSTNLTITYSFRWGETGEWTTRVLAPGERRWHSWTYAYPNKNSSPTPYVRFDHDTTRDRNTTQYRLSAYAAPSQQYRFAKEYVFRKTAGGYLVDLYAS